MCTIALQAFPFDKLKVDQSFIMKLDSNEHAREIIRAVIGLGRGLKLPVVAEGVETQEQIAFLSAEQCYGMQGFLVGRPSPISFYRDLVGIRNEPKPFVDNVVTISPGGAEPVPRRRRQR